MHISEKMTTFAYRNYIENPLKHKDYDSNIHRTSKEHKKTFFSYT